MPEVRSRPGDKGSSLRMHPLRVDQVRGRILLLEAVLVFSLGIWYDEQRSDQAAQFVTRYRRIEK
jgi:hypothetical protein